MDYKNQVWFSELGLKEESFRALPKGQNPIIWALQNNILDSQQYSSWASEHYKLPRIDDSFFNFSMDSSLKSKYQNLFHWNSSCYPIYEWENTLYVACLEPVQLNTKQSTCFVIASLDAMETAWNKNHSTIAPVKKSASVENDSLDAFTDGFEFKDHPKKAVTTAPDLDFSNLVVSNEDSDFESATPEPEIQQPTKNINSDPEEDALGGLSFADLNMSSVDAQSLSSNDEDNNGDFDDDITPPPVQDTILEAVEVPTAQSENENEIDQHTQSMGHEVTETENSAPVYIPKEKRITDEDLKKHTDLNHCQGTKEIISHIFHHLTKDYNKLMWVELSETGQFFPRFVYGPWKLDSSAWNHAIDVSKPNIFRIAFKSSLPFHGKVFENKVNSNYFNLWNNGDLPNQVTAFPLIFDEACFGFITCFDKGPSFDAIDSLKKVENLISLSNKAFQAVHQKKAS